jgi:hypothetical protein
VSTRVETWLYVICDVCGFERVDPCRDGIFATKAKAMNDGWSIKANSTGRTPSHAVLKGIPCDICPGCVAEGHKHEVLRVTA